MYSGAMSREFIVTSLIPRIKGNDALNLPQRYRWGDLDQPYQMRLFLL